MQTLKCLRCPKRHLRHFDAHVSKQAVPLPLTLSGPDSTAGLRKEAINSHPAKCLRVECLPPK